MYNQISGYVITTSCKSYHNHILPALTHQFPCSGVERGLLFLPYHFGGLNIPNPTSSCDFQFSFSELLSAGLAALIQQQTEELQIPYLQLPRSTIRQSRHQLLTSNLEDIKSHVDSQLNQIITLTSVKCSSLWLTTLSLQEQGFYLNKQEFPFFSTDHAMICQHGGLTFICHNELHDLMAGWL